MPGPVHQSTAEYISLLADIITWEAKRVARVAVHRHQLLTPQIFPLTPRAKLALCRKYQRAAAARGVEVVLPCFYPYSRARTRATLIGLLEADGLEVESILTASGRFLHLRISVPGAIEQQTTVSRTPLLTQAQQDAILDAAEGPQTNPLDWRVFHLRQQDGTTRDYRVAVDDEGRGPFLVWEIRLHGVWEELVGPQVPLARAFVIDTLAKVIHFQD